MSEVEFGPEKETGPFFSEQEEEGRRLLMELMGFEEKDPYMLWQFRLVDITFESKVKPQADYESERVYTRWQPVGTNTVDVLVYDPMKELDPTTNAGVFAVAARKIGRMVDGLAVGLAKTRDEDRHLEADRQIVKQDTAQRIKSNRVNAEREVIQPKQPLPVEIL